MHDDDHGHHHDHAAITTIRMGSATMPRGGRCNGRRRTIRPPASPADPRREPDFDLVEAAFVAGFANAPDPTSFLRLARIPFTGATAEGEVLKLLRVETEEAVDVGVVSPPLGGGPMRHDPLPAKLVSRRRRLAFLYFDGTSRPLAELRRGAGAGIELARAGISLSL